MENNITKTEPAQSHQTIGKKIGNVLRKTHYKLGVGGIYLL